MSTKVFNTRLQLKYDSWKNWYDNNPTLLAGEIAIVNVPAQTNESTGEVTQKPAILFKVGDGTTDFRTLDWASGLAADVYGWAKAETKPDYKANEIAVEDNSNFFEGANVESVLAEIWTEIKSLTGGEEGVGSIASQIQTGIEQFAETLGSAAYAATTDFDAAGAAAEVLGTDADVAGTATVHGALKSAAAAKSAADAAQATADAAYVLPEGGIEEDLSAAVKASLEKADSALQTHQDISHLATKDELGDVSDRVETIESDYLKAADKTELEGKITTAQETANAAKTSIDAFLKEADATETAIDTLKEIQAELDAGEANAANLLAEINALKAIDNATQAELDAALETVNGNINKKADQTTVDGIEDRVGTLEAIDHEAYKAYADQAEEDAIATANAYTNTEIGKLHAVATSGKFRDLESEGRATTADAEYVIFYCGTSEILTDPEVTE